MCVVSLINHKLSNPITSDLYDVVLHMIASFQLHLKWMNDMQFQWK